MEYLAHVNPADQSQQSMLNHLTGTAQRASQFAEAFSSADLAYWCGMLHDIGKYSQAFQRRLKGSGEAVDHSTAGAQVAFFQWRNVPAAFCIAGHHTGLPDGGNPKAATAADATFWGKMYRKVGEDLEDYSAFKEEVALRAPTMPPLLPKDAAGQFFFTRMLYSCLVDGDFLDTEAFMASQQVRNQGESLEELHQRLGDFIAPWWNTEIPLNQKRCEILRALMQGGALEKGLFSLTVPTGGGKTVASVAFALEHALAKQLRRVIYVIPYTSIIEQTQQVFEKIFGAENVVAHYASLDYATDELGTITDKRYLATENWDAPIIITTAVQFFESLYANRSSRCRKLHNIANSVIIFDEAQMLPVPYLTPCVDAIAQLVGHYGCSAVLCTATQPSLGRLFAERLPNFSIRELAPAVGLDHLFFQRVQYEQAGQLSDEELARRLSDEQQVLCIVNSKKQAQRVYSLLEPQGAYHLSTTLYPAHRRRVLAEIRLRLKDKKTCRVISTSLVEAGVDVDFPTVYRALAGLDSIIQAAGRCNRENRRPIDQSRVCIFETEQPPPSGMRQNIAAARRVMEQFQDLSSPDAVREYFEFLYYRLKDESELDQKQILREIGSGTMPFATVAELFHIIEESGHTVYIPLEEGAALTERLKAYGPSRSLLRKLGQYAVGVRPDHFNELIRLGGAEKTGQNAAILRDLSLYREDTGLSFLVNAGQGHII